MQRKQHIHRTGSEKQCKVAIVGFDGVEILDITGPHEVFTLANEVLRQKGRIDDAYSITLLSRTPGVLTASSGLRLVADAAWSNYRKSIDTLLIGGGPGVSSLLPDLALSSWLRDKFWCVRRLCSVCTGAFLLAQAGLLDGRRATTHWMATDRLRKQYPRVTVEPDAIYVKDGNIFTSAGVTAGMDMALALLEEDHGKEVALAVARTLVVYLRRPGGQSQFSTKLRAQVNSGQFTPLLTWIEDNFRQRLTVEILADRAAMSMRTFSRAFVHEIGLTPARFVEQVRLEQAIRFIEQSALTDDLIAIKSGFSGAGQLRRVFLHHFGISPQAYRKRFRTCSHNDKRRDK